MARDIADPPAVAQTGGIPLLRCERPQGLHDRVAFLEEEFFGFHRFLRCSSLWCGSFGAERRADLQGPSGPRRGGPTVSLLGPPRRREPRSSGVSSDAHADYPG